MKRGELRHDLCMITFLTDHVVMTPKYIGKIPVGDTRRGAGVICKTYEEVNIGMHELYVWNDESLYISSVLKIIIDVFFNNGQLDFSAISTIINIILFVFLLVITWWNVIQVRKHTEFMIMERDVKEMECLVGKLHSKITDENIFFKLSPESRNSNGEGVKEYFRFWDKIEQYTYLGPPELRSTLNKYIESKLKSSTYEKYESAKADLIKEIKNRYEVLTDKIESSQRKIEE